MRSHVLLTVTLALVFALFGFANSTSYVRYINTQPTFGEADVAGSTKKNGVTQTVGFSDVAPSTTTSYASVNSGLWKFQTNFSRKASASGQGNVQDDTYYTVYTRQTAGSNLRNELLEDGPTGLVPGDGGSTSTSTSGGSNIGENANVRAVNLANFAFPANVYYTTSTSSTPVQLFSSVNYGSASAWTPLAAGMYNFEWEVSNHKRGNEQWNWSVIVIQERRYTIWLTATGPIVTQDAVSSKRRSVSEVRQRRVAQRESVLEQKENVEEDQ